MILIHLLNILTVEGKPNEFINLFLVKSISQAYIWISNSLLKVSFTKISDRIVSKYSENSNLHRIISNRF